MAKRKSENLQPAFIPGNIMQTNRIWGFKTINIIEGAIMAALFTFLICSIPFVLKIKIIICIVCDVVIVAGNAVGIHGNSVLSVLLRRIAYKPLIKRFHYRRLSPDVTHEDILDKEGRVKRMITATPTKNFLDKFNF